MYQRLAGMIEKKPAGGKRAGFVSGRQGACVLLS